MAEQKYDVTYWSYSSALRWSTSHLLPEMTNLDGDYEVSKTLASFGASRLGITDISIVVN